MSDPSFYRGYTVGTALSVVIAARAKRDGDGAKYTFVKCKNGTWKPFDSDQEPQVADGGAYTSNDLASFIADGHWIVERVFGVEPPAPEPLPLIQRVMKLQAAGIRVLFDTDMTLNIHGMKGQTMTGFIGMCGTEEQASLVLARAEAEFGIS